MTATLTKTATPFCTPPPCADNETSYCAEECFGGCGLICVTHTPTPGPLFANPELLGVSFPSGKMMVSFDVSGISGEYYAVISDNEYECDILFPDERPERLFCIGPCQERDSKQLISVFRMKDNVLAFTLDFTIPGISISANTSSGNPSCYGSSCDCGPTSQTSCCPGWVKEIVGECDLSYCNLSIPPGGSCTCTCGYLWQSDCSLVYTGVFGSCGGPGE